jgi:hypothetical protein
MPEHVGSRHDTRGEHLCVQRANLIKRRQFKADVNLCGHSTGWHQVTERDQSARVTEGRQRVVMEALVFTLHQRDRQRVLAREVLVQRANADACALRDRVRVETFKLFRFAGSDRPVLPLTGARPRANVCNRIGASNW